MYADYQVYFDIAGASASIASVDAWMYNLCRNEMEVNGGWDRQIVPPYIEYTTDAEMVDFVPGAYEQWRVVETNELNPAAPIIVANDLHGFTVPINQAPYFIKSVIVTGSISIAAAHAGVMQAIATMHPDWIQGPTTVNGSGHHSTRWVVSETDPVDNGISPNDVPSTVLSGLLKRLHTEHGNVVHGGYIMTNQPRFGNGINEHNNPGQISVFIYQDPNLFWAYAKLSTLAEFNAASILHPFDVSNSVAATGLFFTPTQTIGFINPHQVIFKMGADASWLLAGCPKLVDIRRSGSELPVPVETAFYGVAPRNAGSGRGNSFYTTLATTGAAYLHLNGTTRINNSLDSSVLASPHIPYWHVAAANGFAPRPARWASGRDDSVDARGEIYEPWFGYNPFSSSTRGAYFSQLFDCIVINDGQLVEGAELTFDGRLFKVFTAVKAIGLQPFAQLAFRVGTEEDAESHP